MLFNPRNGKRNPTVDFRRYPDREVVFMGIPYPGSKKIDSVWFLKRLTASTALFRSKANCERPCNAMRGM